MPTADNPIKRMLSERQWLLADGATGSNLFDVGLQSGDAPELWNTEHPDRISALHQSFVDAGADIILTNSFGGNRYRLALHGAQDRVSELNKAAARLAREVADAAGRPVIVAGSMGPTGEILAPLGELSIDDAQAAFDAQARGLVEGGADVLWIETMSAEQEVQAAVRAAEAVGLPVVCTLSFDTNGRTMMGIAPSDFAALNVRHQHSLTACGANCGVGPAEMVASVINLTRAAPDAIIVAKANCGIPGYVDGRLEYDGTPELMAEFARLALDAGARIIGGCCGTSPAHLNAMYNALRTHNRRSEPGLTALVGALGEVSTGSVAQLAGNLDRKAGAASASAQGGRERGRRRRGGRAAKQALRRQAEPAVIPYITRRIAPYQLLDEEGLALIEHNADTILQEVGIEFRDDDSALSLLREAGADVQGQRVRFERGMCRQIIQRSAPAQFTQHARNPARSVQIGGNHTVFAPAYGSPFVRDLAGGRRYAGIEDFRNFVKLAYLTPWLHHSGGTLCEPVDLPVNKRHLDMLYAHIRMSDKPFMGSVTHPDRAADSVAMAHIAFGDAFIDAQTDKPRTVLINLINVNSPMVYDATMLGAARTYAQNNQATIISPFILAGAMSPVTTAGVAAQTLAEALAGMTYVQLVNPGSPVVFGSFASSMSMQSGAPTFGTPEPALVLYVVAALARRLGVPFRSGGSLCASKVPDAQAAYESAATLFPSCQAGVNFVLHAAGWLEGGLTMGYEKFVMDADQLGMMHTLLGGVDLSANGQALDAIAEVGPGNHFLGCQHTQANFETAFYRSPIADNNSFEQWESDGALDLAGRAAQRCEQLLQSYQAPAIDAGIDEALNAYMIQKKAEVPDATH